MRGPNAPHRRPDFIDHRIPLTKIIGDAGRIAAHGAEYDSFADFLHDETAACERCGLRWYQGPPGGFDADIRAVEGVLVCGDCAGPYLFEAAAKRGWGRLGAGDEISGARTGFATDAAEHGTYRTRSGEVVG